MRSKRFLHGGWFICPADRVNDKLHAILVSVPVERLEMRRCLNALAAGLTAACAVSALLLLAPRADAQQGYKAPRTPWGDGKPDLNGIWQAIGSANWSLEDHAAYGAPSSVQAIAGTVSAAPGGFGVVDGPIPYKPEALKQRQQNFENRWTLDPELKCFQAGLPRATYLPYPFQILQSTNKILVAYEYAKSSRTIHLDKKVEAPVPQYMGQSNGRWEGDTLVVEVTDFREESWFDRAGNYHSDALKVTERFTPTSPYHMTYEATIEDSNVFTRPWKITVPLYKRVDRNVQLMEFNCVPFSEDLIYGQWKRR
jgi:hypothetical protein